MAGVDERARPAAALGPTRRLAWQLPERRRRGRSITRRDLVLSGVLLFFQLCLSAAAEHRHSGQVHLDALASALLVVGPLALLAWRRHPVAVLWITFAATLGTSATRFGYLSLLVAFFLAATGSHRQAAWTVVVVGYVTSLWLAPLAWGQSRASLDGALILGGWLAVLVIAAEVVRLRRERLAEARAARQVEQSRRASEERLRMARDIHDVIGHNISLINVQAAVGLDLMDAQPEAARAALAAIKTVSKDALGELRTLLAALRQDGDETPRSPTPGLDRLDELIDLTRAAGLQVTLETVGQPVALPAPVDLTAYRIVQEALTNVTRHAPGAAATVRLRYQPDAIVVEVLDTGRPGPAAATTPATPATTPPATTPATPAAGTGTGIAGMRERARALGGELHAGPRPEGGFGVLARLPLEAQA